MEKQHWHTVLYAILYAILFTLTFALGAVIKKKNNNNNNKNNVNLPIKKLTQLKWVCVNAVNNALN